jgi:hypothetical protein
MINLIPVAHAADQVVGIGEEVTKGGFFAYTCIGKLVGNVIGVAFILAAVAAFVLLVLGGLNWLTSGGDKAKIETAQKMISNALIGLAIVAASYAIYSLVLDFFGIDLSKICSLNPI